MLRLIDITVKAAHAHGKWVGVCGALASETMAVPVLIGLGVDELSVSVPLIPTIKATVRELDLHDCRSSPARCWAWKKPTKCARPCACTTRPPLKPRLFVEH